jgi:fumarate hydratase subunit beta
MPLVMPQRFFKKDGKQMIDIKVNLPLDEKTALSLKAGDSVYLSGTLITARDAAHERLALCLQNKEPLPVNIVGEVIYYVGPAPAKPGFAVGSAGPTSSYRMDTYTPALLDHGLKGMIGKGDRNHEVIQAIIRNKAVYFAAIGGLGATISKSIIKSEVLAYEDLGTEAIQRFWIKDFPAIVVIDAYGNDLYTIEQAKYRK